jgi:hypothetical protein
MKKIFQEVVDKGFGDCVRATMASLFEMNLHDVPDFMKEHTKENPQALQVMRFMESKGYPDTMYINPQPDETIEQFQKILAFDGGIDGLFYASVDSQTFEDTSHAVIINAKMEIVHDPNKNGRALELGPEAIKSVMTVTDFYVEDGECKRSVCCGGGCHV